MTYLRETNFTDKNMKCKKCQKEKNKTEFYPNKAYRIGFHPWCKSCFIITLRNCYLKRTYGLTQEQYLEMLTAQDGGCAICGKKEDPKKSLAVDHDKNTGQVRGILCENCNRGIGLLNHDVELLKRSIEYLNQFY